jgi:glutaredoxin 2
MRTDRQTDMRKLIVVFRNFSKAPKNKFPAVQQYQVSVIKINQLMLLAETAIVLSEHKNTARGKIRRANTVLQKVNKLINSCHNLNTKYSLDFHPFVILQ